MPVNKFFRVSSGLKSIIGRDLITDDFIAVFELVKNSFDAGAKRVDISFIDLETETPSLIIKDDGKGMSRADLINKWLFVAYSAKKEGTEDYRDRIKSPRIYAGAKGIGRFSCDRLGRRLEVISRTKKQGQYNKLSVNWDEFEQDSNKEFINIPVQLSAKKKIIPGLSKGTLLHIKGLRGNWNRDKLLKLKRSLEKLINPNQQESQSFKIFISAPSELEADKKEKKNDTWKQVNGEVRNFIFEELKIKATTIHVWIGKDGKFISTRLEDRGRYIYELTEENSLGISNIDVHLFVLNQAAKTTFTKSMGVQPVQYGSLFLFKNGFRIYPYGERGEDPWGIDDRKQQGQARFLGTRDLIGRVEIHGRNSQFQEASSRDGGLIKNKQVENLRVLVFDYALRRLERFAVDVIKWGKHSSGEVKSKTLELILSLTKSKNLVGVDYNPRVLDIVSEASEKSLSAIIGQFRDLADKTGNTQLERDAKKAERRMRELQKAREEAEKEARKAEEEAKKAEEEAKRQAEIAKKVAATAKRASKQQQKVETQNLFLQSIVSADVNNLVGLHHHIGIAALTIQNHIKNITKRIRSGRPVTSEMFLEVLEKISLEARQIQSSTGFATKANFTMDAARISQDILEFVREYVFNVCKGVVLNSQKKPMVFIWEGDSDIEFVIKFRPFQVAVLLDNIFSNASKANANTIIIGIKEVNDDSIIISFSDDGKGIPKKSVQKIFEAGYTTTNGSGFGLFHSAGIARQMGGSIEVNKSKRKGGEFLWKIVK